VGLGAGIVLLVVLGLVNVLTIAAMAESVTRTGIVRYGNAFFGRVVGEYLGGLGSVVCTLANVALNATALLAYFVGFARVMGDVIRLPVELWAGLAVLAIAMVSVHTALALFNAVRERLPEASVASRGSHPSPFARGPFWWCLLPVLLIFAVAEWLLFSHNESFTGVMNFGGVVGASVFSGIFPVLLLAASRRKGDLLPAVVYRLIGHPLLLGAVYLLFLAGIWLHGLVIWQNPVQRLAAVTCGLAVLIMTLLTVKQGAFRRRLVVQFRQNRGDEQAMFSIVAGGKAAEADVVATDGEGDACYHAASGQVPNWALLRRLTLQLRNIPAHEAKVWAHQVEPEGTSTPLPAYLSLRAADGEVRATQGLGGGPVLLPWSGKEGCVELEFRSTDLATAPENGDSLRAAGMAGPPI
jgi:hypothetical protein